MRKSTKIMAGLGVVAGLGVALAPLATFADGAGDDTLVVTVVSACDLTQAGSPAADVVIDNKYTKEGNPGQTVQLIADTSYAGARNGTIEFDCSTNSQVEVKARATDLDHASGHATDYIPAANVGAYYTGGADTTITPAYAVNTAGSYGKLSDSETKVAETTLSGAANAATFTVSGYEVTIKNDQKPGVYTGHVYYTFYNI